MGTKLSKITLYHYLQRSLIKIFRQPHYQQVLNPKDCVMPLKQSQKNLFFEGDSLCSFGARERRIFVSFDNSTSYKLYQLLGSNRLFWVGFCSPLWLASDARLMEGLGLMAFRPGVPSERLVCSAGPKGPTPSAVAQEQGPMVVGLRSEPQEWAWASAPKGQSPSFKTLCRRPWRAIKSTGLERAKKSTTLNTRVVGTPVCLLGGLSVQAFSVLKRSKTLSSPFLSFLVLTCPCVPLWLAIMVVGIVGFRPKTLRRPKPHNTNNHNSKPPVLKPLILPHGYRASGPQPDFWPRIEACVLSCPQGNVVLSNGDHKFRLQNQFLTNGQIITPKIIFNSFNFFFEQKTKPQSCQIRKTLTFHYPKKTQLVLKNLNYIYSYLRENLYNTGPATPALSTASVGLALFLLVWSPLASTCSVGSRRPPGGTRVQKQGTARCFLCPCSFEAQGWCLCGARPSVLLCTPCVDPKGVRDEGPRQKPDTEGDALELGHRPTDGRHYADTFGILHYSPKTPCFFGKGPRPMAFGPTRRTRPLWGGNRLEGAKGGLGLLVLISRRLARSTAFGPKPTITPPHLLLAQKPHSIFFVYQLEKKSFINFSKRNTNTKNSIGMKPFGHSIRFSKYHKHIFYFSLVRPLFSITRLDTFYLCEGLKLPLYPDKSNETVYFLRNRLRKQVVPAIRTLLNPQFETLVCNFSETFF